MSLPYLFCWCWASVITFSADSDLRTRHLTVLNIISWTQVNTCGGCAIIPLQASVIFTWLLLFAGGNWKLLSYQQRLNWSFLETRKTCFEFSGGNNCFSCLEFPVSLSEFQFVFTAVWCSYIYIYIYTGCIKMIGAVLKLIIFTSMGNRIINTSRNERVTQHVYDTYLQIFDVCT